MIDWIASELGTRTVLHISRYFPTYKLNEPATSEGILSDLFRLARKKLKFVYLGNLRTSEGKNTYCPNCNTLAISRSGYFTEPTGLSYNGKCLNCGAQVINKDCTGYSGGGT